LSDKLELIVASYFADLRDKRGLGAGTPERSYYPAVAKLLDAVGQQLKPEVLCLSDLGNTGSGQPDFGLYVANQVQKGEPRKGQAPERGVIEMKPVKDDAWLIADTKQVSKYWEAYGLVIVTNLRDFLILGKNEVGKVTKLETFRLAKDEPAFWEMVSAPQKSANQVGRAFGEYLKRALAQTVKLREPKEVAWFLASYGRDALQRVEEAGNLPELASIRSSLEEALGVTFDGEKGEHFFRSTLVQTLFYGVFSAWALWAKSVPRSSPHFDWHTAVWHLNVPFVTTLFQQLASPAQLQPLHLVEVLDWTAATLNRVDADAFTARFNDADAVQYFYEPFLEAFDPELKKELGVWYTPAEVITYMVARVDKALRDELGIADGLASEQVYILDPCCGTGGYLAAVLKRIDANLAERGFGALKGQMVKKAATTRVFGFEILPAPFVVAHLKIGLVLQSLGATLQAGHDRVGVYLTNALTGWEPVTSKPLPFPELEEERKKADKVKQQVPILVILGNPPYNGFAGMAQELPEERSLSLAYRTTKKVRRPEGQGLNDLYIRFFRMAERRIAEKTGRGIVCFISNYSWLDGLSFTGMRERYLEAFDTITVDCLNGDKFKTGKTTPEGAPDPSIFSTEHNREGIQVGTAIATLIRKESHAPIKSILFRHVWGTAKLQELLNSAEAEPSAVYKTVTPSMELGLPFIQTDVSFNYYKWPKLPELLPSSFSGVKTSRDEFLVSIDRHRLEDRLASYFNQSISNDVLRLRFPAVMTASTGFDPIKTRDELLKRGPLFENIVRYTYRPFDVRWLYWERETKLLDRNRSEYWPHVFEGNVFVEARERQPKEDFDRGTIVRGLADNFGNGLSHFFPLYLHELAGSKEARLNLSQSLEGFLKTGHLKREAIFWHVAAILHAPSYRGENGGALRMDWPRVPVPADPKLLEASADLGSTVISFLDAETSVTGVTKGKLRPCFRVLGLPHKDDGKPLNDTDLAMSAGWGHVQTSSTGSLLVMPGSGHVKERDYSTTEHAAMVEEAKALGRKDENILDLIGHRTYDIYLNEHVMWTNVPEKIWDYKLGGYQVIKKWLSYRENAVLGRALKPDEVAYFSEMVRRIAAILLLSRALDANYTAAKTDALEWRDGRPVL
jgi:SAM-dependent methyltransferase